MAHLTSENDWLDWLANEPKNAGDVKLGIGDDCAWLAAGENLITADLLLEGVHFDSHTARPQEIGYKALACSLSDVAAMAGEPYAAVISLAIRKGISRDFLPQLWSGLSQAAKRFSVSIVGGDTTSWNQGLAINVTMLARPHFKGAVTRRGARPGDAICVTGELGGSLLGRHMSFTPRIEEARFLYDHYDLKAMMDLSDGLATDLNRMCVASGCGGFIEASKLPVSSALSHLPSPAQITHALNDGEDFELLFALPMSEAEALVASSPFVSCNVSLIGEFSEGQGVFMQSSGERILLERSGFNHQF